MRFLLSCLFALSVFSQTACAQQAKPSANRLGHCQNPKFDQEVAQWLHFTVAAIDADSLRKVQNTVLLLDAREPKEYAISHLPGAVNCGYEQFDRALVDSLARNRPIVVYCSIGYRSEKIAEQLLALGFPKVSNLYGSIFEWANRGYPLVDAQARPTLRLHTFNRDWGRWVDGSKCQKVN